MSSRKTVYLKQLNQPSGPVMWGKLKVLPEWREKIEFLGYVLYFSWTNITLHRETNSKHLKTMTIRIWMLLKFLPPRKEWSFPKPQPKTNLQMTHVFQHLFSHPHDFCHNPWPTWPHPCQRRDRKHQWHLADPAIPSRGSGNTIGFEQNSQVTWRFLFLSSKIFSVPTCLDYIYISYLPPRILTWQWKIIIF